MADGEPRSLLQRAGLIAGPLLAAAVALWIPGEAIDASGAAVGFGPEGRATAALATWMAVWWLSEAIPIYATALLPLVVLPLSGAAPIRAAAAPYAHELIFLFMGGFLLALAMERCGLHRRIALVTLSLVGDDARRIIGGFMLVAALLSMWVSNTATAIMLLPVATSVIDLVARQLGENGEGGEASTGSDSELRPFAVCLLLGVAYASSIGGLGTPIGTPPNVLLLSYLRDHLGLEIGFARWMAFALPLVAVFLPLCWWLLTHWLYPVRLGRIGGARSLVRGQLAALGPLQRAEWIVLVTFAATALAWVTRPLLVDLELFGAHPFAELSDAGIAMTAALLLFVAPAAPGRATLDWDTALRLPWGILLLFGGGLSLAAAIRANGVGELLASGVGGIGAAPAFLVVLVVTAGIVFLTELTSNTATAATLIPLLAALAPGLQLEPLALIVPAALAASCAFMLPVATPPNAIVFGSGRVAMREMSSAGFWLNWIGVALIGLATWGLLPILSGG